MTVYIALIRGINVGGKNLVPMKSLVSILDQVGCSNIQTYIQSGNVVFEGADQEWAPIISEAISAEFDFVPEVLVLEASELDEVIARVPFPTEDGKALHAYFLDSEPSDPDLSSMEALSKPSEQFRLYEKVFYLYAPDGIGRSKLASSIEKLLGVSATARNWNTVNKLLELSFLLQNSD